MTPAVARGLVRRVGPDPEPPADADLVARFARHRDPAAFADLVRRHGPMVLAACRRMLPTPADAEDAFQAVFLVLVRKAGCVRPPGAVGGWLHGVAVRTAQKARVAAARRRRREMSALASPGRQPGGGDAVAVVPGSPEHAELRAALDEELARLPDPLRAAVVLCDLGGKTRAEAAADLGCPEGTLAARLHRARRLLADRLARRGVTAPAAFAATAAVPADLFASVTGFAAGGAVPRAVRALAEGVVRSMTAQPLSLVFAAVAAVGLAAGAGMLWAAGAPSPDAGAAPAAEEAPAPPARTGPVYAVGYSADGSRLVSVGGTKAVVHDTATGADRFAVDAEFAHFSGDGKTLFAFAGERFLTLDAATGKTLASGPRAGPNPGLGGRWAVAAPDGSRRVEYTRGRQTYTAFPAGGGLPDLQDQRVYDYDGASSTIIPSHGRAGAFRPDGVRYAGIHAGTAGSGQTACVGVWNADPAGTRLGTLSPGRDDPAWSLAWSADGRRLAVGFARGVRVYDADALTEQWALPGRMTTAVAWSADGRTVAAAEGEWDGGPRVVRVGVRLVDAGSGKELRRIDGFADSLPVTALAFRPDGKELACGSGFLPGDEPAANAPQPVKGAGGLRRVPLDPPAAPAPDHVSDVSFSPDGTRYVVVAYKAGIARATDLDRVFGLATVRDAATDRALWEAPAQAARFTADGKAVLTLGAEVARHDAATGKVLETHPRGQAEFELVFSAFSPDGRRYAGHGGFTARVFDTATATPTRLLPDRGRPAYIAAQQIGSQVLFSPDGKRVAAVGVVLDKGHLGAEVWDAATGERVPGFLPDITLTDRLVVGAAFSPDGKTLALANRHDVYLWADGGGKELRREAFLGTLGAVAYLPDGRLVVAGEGQYAAGGDKSAEETVYQRRLFVQVVDRSQPDGGFVYLDRRTVRPEGAPRVTALAISPDGKTALVAAGGLTRISLTEPQPPAPAQRPAVPVWRERTPLRGTVDGPVDSVAFAPGGKAFLTGGNWLVKNTDDRGRPLGGGKEIAVAVEWRLADLGKQWLSVLGGPGPVGVAYSPDGTLVAATRPLGTGLYEAADGAPKGPAFKGGKVAAFSPDGKYLAVGDGKRWAIHPAGGGDALFDLPTEPEPPGENRTAALAWSPDGTRLAVPWHAPGGKGFGFDVLTLQTRQTKTLAGHPARVTAVAWSPDGKHIATGCGKGDVILWDAATFKELRRTRLGGRGGEGVIHALAFAPGGQALAAAVSFDEGKNAERVVMLGPATGDRLGIDLQGFRFAPRALAFAPDGKTLVVGLGGAAGGKALGEVRVYTTDPEPAAPGGAAPPAGPGAWRPRPVTTERAAVAAAAFDPQGKTFLVGGADGVVELWQVDTLTGRPGIHQLKGPVSQGALTYVPRGGTLVYCADADGIMSHDPTGRKMSHRFSDYPARTLAFPPTDTALAARAGDLGKVFGRPPVGEPPPFGTRVDFTGPGRPAPMAWAPDGKRLVYAAQLPSSGFWTLAVAGDPRPGARLNHGPDPLGGMAWAPDGAVVVTGGWDGAVVVSDGATLEEVRRWTTAGPGQKSLVRSVVMTPDGATILAGVETRQLDQTRPAAPTHAVVGWDVATGREVVRLDLPAGGPVDALILSPDGRLLVAGRNVADAPGPAPKVPPPALLVWERPAPAAPAPAAAGPGQADGWRVKAVLTSHPDSTAAVAFAPDGKTLATAGTEDGRLVVHDAASFKALRETTPVPKGGRFYSLAYAPDGKTLAAGFSGSSFHTLLFDPATAAQTGHVQRAGDALAYSPDGTRLAVARANGVCVVDPATGKDVALLPGPKAFFEARIKPLTKPGTDVPLMFTAGAAWGPGGKTLAVIRHEKRANGWPVTFWSPVPGRQEPPGEAAVHADQLTAIAASPDGTMLASGDAAGDVVLWEGATWKETHRVRLVPPGTTGLSTVNALAVSPDGKTVAAALTLGSGAEPNRVALIDTATGQVTAQLRRGWRLSVVSLAWSPDGKTLATACGYGPTTRGIANPPHGAGEVVLWDRTNGTAPVQPAAPPEPPVTVPPAPLPAVPAPAWRELGPLQGGVDGPVDSVAFAPDGKAFATAGFWYHPADPMRGEAFDAAAAEWDLNRLAKRWLTRVGGPRSVGVGYSPDGKLVAATTTSGFRLLDAATGRPTELLDGGLGMGPLALAFSGAAERVAGQPRYRVAVSNGRKTSVVSWAEGGRPSTATSGPVRGAVATNGPLPLGVAFSPDGKQVVFIPSGKTDPRWVAGTPEPDPAKATHWYAQVWESEKGTVTAVLPHGGSLVTAVAWSPDGRFIATGSEKGGVVVWDAKTFQRRHSLRFGGAAELGTVHSLAFDPDGKTLAAAVTLEGGKEANRVELFDPTTGSRITPGIGGFGAFTPTALAFAPDGKTLVVGCSDRSRSVFALRSEDHKALGAVRVFTTAPR